MHPPSRLASPGALTVARRGQFEDSGRKPLANRLDPGQARLDSGHVLIRKAHLGRAEVFLHAVQAARAEDRHDAGPSCEEPARAAARYPLLVGTDVREQSAISVARLQSLLGTRSVGQKPGPHARSALPLVRVPGRSLIALLG
jgi:hypothetical protein